MMLCVISTLTALMALMKLAAFLMTLEVESSAPQGLLQPQQRHQLLKRPQNQWHFTC